MPSSLFDSAALAIVAYAEVIGSDGSSPNTNSGVVTTKIGTGQYTVTLPANQQQSGSRDLIFVTPKAAAGQGLATPLSHAINDQNAAVKEVAIYGGSPILSYADADFSILILRTTIVPPTGSPA